jgi:hypothetical protein
MKELRFLLLSAQRGRAEAGLRDKKRRPRRNLQAVDVV